MFTGIVESLGKITKIESEGNNLHFTLQCPFANELKIDQSLAHDGVCLTVVKCESSSYTVTAIQETLKRSSLGVWAVGKKVNLERCLRLGDRLDGHMVQGHVDTTGTLVRKESRDGSYLLKFEHPYSQDNPQGITISKGSITINGISLTVVDSAAGSFSVALIPYTWSETNMHLLTEGDKVNLEFDIFGKYISKMMAVRF
ncbi:MAG: riboflavin synthase [Flavobacteriales bacterium]|nr:riboflavin synthase [Flavobacteriales bacterium]